MEEVKVERLDESVIKETHEMDNSFRGNFNLGLEGRVSILTGCSSGLGAATTKAFLRQGLSVVGCYSSQADSVNSTAEAIREVEVYAEQIGAGGRFKFYDKSIADEDTPKFLVDEALEYYSRLDVLCNFAGIPNFGPFLELTREGYDELMAVNLKGHMFLTQESAKAMSRNAPGIGGSRGSIINMSSIVGTLVGEEGTVNYAASKGGISGVTLGMAEELGPFGIRVNAIAPGSILTPIQMRDYADSERRKAIEDRTCLKRWGFPTEIANLSLFLASDLSSYITGETIQIGGGMGHSFRL